MAITKLPSPRDAPLLALPNCPQRAPDTNPGTNTHRIKHLASCNGWRLQPFSGRVQPCPRCGLSSHDADNICLAQLNRIITCAKQLSSHNTDSRPKIWTYIGLHTYSVHHAINQAMLLVGNGRVTCTNVSNGLTGPAWGDGPGTG